MNKENGAALAIADNALAEQRPLPAANSIEGLLLAAVERGATVDQLERLMTLRQQMQAEVAKRAFDEAMARFQSQCPAIRKDKQVMVKGQLRYCYAPLESVVAQVKDLLGVNGLSYAINAEVKGQSVMATCTVKHLQGHQESSSFEVPIQADAYMSEPQKFASAMTFAKRYSFLNAFGIMTADDDTDNAEHRNDGALPVGNGKPSYSPRPTSPPPPHAPRPTTGGGASGHWYRAEVLDCKEYDGQYGPGLEFTLEVNGNRINYVKMFEYDRAQQVLGTHPDAYRGPLDVEIVEKPNPKQPKYPYRNIVDLRLPEAPPLPDEPELGPVIDLDENPNWTPGA